MDTSLMDELGLEIKIERALKCEPGKTLQDTLVAKTVEQLKDTAKKYHLNGYSRLNKKGLMELIGEALVNPEFMEELIYILMPRDWQLFKAAAETDCFQSDEYQIFDYHALQEMGYIQSYFYQDHFYYVMPREVREVFAALKKDGVEERRARSELLNHYAAAAIRLYGVITEEEFIDIFNSQNTVPTDEEELYTCLMRKISNGGTTYCYLEDNLIDVDLNNDGLDRMERLFQAVDGKPRYIPGKQEFIKFADPDYFDDTVNTQAFLEYLQKEMMLDEIDAGDLLAEIQYICEQEMPFSECFDAFTGYNVYIKKSQVQKLGKLIANVRNSIRLWSNNGHTNNEIFQMFGAIPQPGENRKVRKVGRNDPCPCGSGKKYKKCCGR